MPAPSACITIACVGSRLMKSGTTLQNARGKGPCPCSSAFAYFGTPAPSEISECDDENFRISNGSRQTCFQ